MEELPESIRQPFLRPVIGLMGPRPIFELLLKKFGMLSPEARLDFEHLEYGAELRPRRESKLLDRQKVNGILKQTWTSTMRRLEPGAIVLMVDWTGPNSLPLDTPEWKSKEAAINNELRKIKEKVRGKVMKVAVVISLGEEEDANLEEKTASLRRNCELDSKGIVLSRDGLRSFEPHKLRKYLVEVACSHYKDEIEKYKKAKARALKEASLPSLQVRYDFKLGYLNELRQDREDAINFYKKAYQGLCSFSPKDYLHFEEIRAVADWTIYRVWAVLLCQPGSLAYLKEAISQFRAHLSRFRQLVHRGLMPYEMPKWLTNNYVRFGELMQHGAEQFVDQDNVWTHSALYFQTAATYILQRRRGTVEDPEFMQSVMSWKNFIAKNQLSIQVSGYLGQSQKLKADSEHADMLEGISALDQTRILKTIEESEYPHLQYAVDLLFRSLKFYQSEVIFHRMVDAISFNLSDLYEKKGELALCYKIRGDLWKKFKDWPKLSLKILDELTQFSGLSEQERAQWLLAYASQSPTEAPDILSVIRALIEQEGSQFHLYMPDSLVSVRPKFVPKVIRKYERATFTCVVTSQLPLSFADCVVEFVFSPSEYTCKLEQPVTLGDRLELALPILAVTDDLIQLEHVLIHYFPHASTQTTFQCMSTAILEVLVPDTCVGLRVEHQSPAYIAEEYRLKLWVEPRALLKEATLEITDEPIDDTKRRRASIDRYTLNKYLITHGEEGREYSDCIQLPDLAEAHCEEVAIVFYEEGTYTFKLILKATVVNQENIEYPTELIASLNLEVLAPFEAATKVTHLNGKGIIFVTFQMQEHHGTGIQVHAVEVAPSAGWEVSSGPLEFSNGFELDAYAALSEAFPYLQTGDVPELAGDVRINWSRKGCRQAVCNIPFLVTLPEPGLFACEVKVAASTRCQEVVQLDLTVTNLTDEALELQVAMEELEAVYVGGPVTFKTELTSKGTFVYDFALLLLQPGNVKLPSLTLVASSQMRLWEGRILVHP